MTNTESVTKAFVADEIITIDPGKHFGICKFKDGKYESWPMKQFDSFESMVDFFADQKKICKLPLVILEKITFRSNLPEDGINRMKRHYIDLLTAVKISGMQLIEVTPRVWQSYLQILIHGEDYEIRKRRYKDIALDWFPGIKVVGWNADALLMIEFTRRKLKYHQRWIHQQLMKKKVKSNKLF